MKNSTTSVIVFVSIILIGIVFWGGCDAKPQATVSNKISIVTTIGMIADAVSNVGGEHVQVQALMGPGVDPHLYKAREGDVRRLSNADAIFYCGLHLEGKMSEVLAQLSAKIPTYSVGDSLPPELLLSPPQGAGLHDPHIWFDVSLWAKTIDFVAHSLSAIEPQHKAYFEQRAKQYKSELSMLHAWVGKVLEGIPNQSRVLVTAHDAFHYFGNAYSFEVRGLQGISTVAETATREIMSLADFIVQRKISAIFVESSVSDKSIRALQEAVRSRGFDVAIGASLFSDAMGNAGTPEGTYVGMVRHNVNAIAAALGNAKEANKDTNGGASIKRENK